MRRVPLHLVALLLGVAAALAVGCGDRSNLMPAGQADSLKLRLAEARAAIAAGECPAAQQAIDAAYAEATQGIDSEVDRRLRSRINDGVRQLRKVYGDDCAAVAAGPQTTETTEPTTTETETTETQAVPSSTTPAETTPTETTPTETTPSSPQPSSPEPPASAEPDTGGIVGEDDTGDQP